MKRYFLFLAVLFVSGLIVLGQSRGGNWPTYGGDAQRSGWEGADASISKDTVKNLQLLWKIKLEIQAKGMRPVMPPIIQGRLISYRGFKELAFVATNADIVYAIDADLGTIFWQRHLEYSAREPKVTTSSWKCPGGLTAMPTMPPPPARGAAPAPAGAQRGSAFIGGPASVYALSSDGRLHRLNTSTGDDMTQPVSVLPANALATSLNMVDNIIYTVTSHECNDVPDAVWSIDLNVDPPRVRSAASERGSSWSMGGTVIGSDGRVHVSSARDASPAVFQYKDRELVVSVCSTSRLCVLESPPPPIVQSSSGASNVPERGIWGSLSSWQDTDGTRWVLAPVTGPNGTAPNGSIAAFQVQEQGGKVTLSPAWVSRDLPSPLAPVIANGVVFALSAGEFTRTAADERPKSSTHATLYAFDARTGKELYSSRNLVTVPASLTGLTVANGRVYFGGIDGTVYAFGMYLEH